MSTFYSVSKCKYISFIKNSKHVDASRVVGRKLYIDDKHSIKELEKELSRTEDPFTLFVDSESKEFDDIEIEVDDSKAGAPNKQEKTQEVRQDIMLGGGKHLEAFSKSRFTIINGKRNASIQPLHNKQNHEVIDSISRNGILVSPKPSTATSVGKLMNILAKCSEFRIVVINSGLVVDRIDGTYPTEYVEPAYVTGVGEISAIFYRYICLYFFGYLGVYDDTDRERNYDI